jgi:hypothetical protein
VDFSKYVDGIGYFGAHAFKNMSRGFSAVVLFFGMFLCQDIRDSPGD